MRKPSFRRGFHPVRKPVSTHYLDVSTGIALASTVDANYSVLLASDSPDKTIVTNLSSTVAQCENGSRILKKGSFLLLNFLSDGPGIVNLWVYMNEKGTVVAPTDSDDFSQGPLTLANQQLREHTIFYKSLTLDTNAARQIRIPLGSRRNNYMGDTNILVLAVDNTTTTAISFNGYGRVRTVEG